MQELSEDGLRIVQALIKASVAWQTPADLARTLGLEIDETNDILASLDADGWLAVWERLPELVVTLSVAGASLLGLRLVETGLDEVPRWAGIGDPEPPGLRASGVFRDQRTATLELLADPAGSAEEAAERIEEAYSIADSPRQRATHNGKELPIPTLLIGLGLTPWLRSEIYSPRVAGRVGRTSLANSPQSRDGQPSIRCPACGSKTLKPSMYCLYCDRWGLDHLLLDEPPTLPVTADSEIDARRREVEQKSRKSRRKARLLAQVSAERASKRQRRPA